MPVIKTAMQRRSAQGGYTLLEILIAAILLTGGLIGLATMQVNGTRLNNSAYLRTQANIQAYDIIDRMRANQAEARTGGYDILLTDPTPAATATARDIDLVQWRGALAYYLPAGTGAIERVSGGAPDQPARITVTVQWNDGRVAADVVDFVVTTDL